jgi:hypothetical protein
MVSRRLSKNYRKSRKVSKNIRKKQRNRRKSYKGGASVAWLNGGSRDPSKGLIASVKDYLEGLIQELTIQKNTSGISDSEIKLAERLIKKITEELKALKA